MELEKLKTCFAAMLRIRLFEQRIAALYPEQQMRCPVHFCIGQEAVAVGVCAALARQDGVFSNHRSHGHYLARGGNMRAMVAEFYGKATGCSRGKGGSMHLIDLEAGFLGAVPIVANTIPVAVGAAFSAKYRRSGQVIAVFFGEGATEEGVFCESLNFAALHALPVIFVCENNLYSVYSGLAVRQPRARDNCLLARGFGIESLRGDGNDLLQVAHLSAAAVEKARAGNGPMYLEFSTYRWMEHCGPNFDNALGYRSETEFKSYRKRCPIENLESILMESMDAYEPWRRSIEKEIIAEIEDAVQFAKRSPFPPPVELRNHVYHHRLIESKRLAVGAYS